MKTIKLVLATVMFVTITSCGGGISKEAPNEEGFEAIEEELKSKFGDNAYYTDLNISHDRTVGNIISVTVTKNPASLKMGAYVYSNHTSWKQNSEITLEAPEGTNAADFMFQLDDKINLKKLGELVETSSKKLTAEKGINNPRFEMAFIQFPKNGNILKTEYMVKLEPENGGTSFTFSYELDGTFIKMNY